MTFLRKVAIVAGGKQRSWLARARRPCVIAHVTTPIRAR
jgi:hypothetical protein